MLVGIACLGFLYAPLLTFLRAPPTKEEKKVSDVNASDANVVTTITNDDATAKKGIFNIAMTLDNGDLALPQSTLSGGNHIATEQCVTKL